MEHITDHHIFYDKNVYTKEGRVYRMLRSHPGLILPLPWNIHEPLHQKLHSPGVPIPDPEATKYFLENLATYQDGQPLLKTVDNAIWWFDIADEDLTAEHLSEQREFIVKKLGENAVYGVSESEFRTY